MRGKFFAISSPSSTPSVTSWACWRDVSDIAASPYLAADPLSDLVARFRRAHPAVTFRVVNPRRSDVQSLVRASEAEIGFADVRPPGDDLEIHPLPDEELFIGTPPGWPPASDSRRSDPARSVPLVMWAPVKALALELLASRGVVADIVLETDHQASVVPMVVSGVGGALVAGGRAQQLEAQGGTLHSFDPPLFRRGLLVARRGSRSPAADAFWRLAVDRFDGFDRADSFGDR